MHLLYRLLSLLLPLLLLSLPYAGHAADGKLVLIIDDMGYNRQDIDALSLPGAVTFAILPHTPFSRSYALKARDANKDVILHIPMESLSGKELGPGALLSDMSQQQIETHLSAALNEIPFAIGINNHMGSLLTQMHSPMSWTMDFLQRHQLFFVDSKTSRFSLGEELAEKVGIPSFHRNVFIDNDLSPVAMAKQFRQLIRIAQRYQHAIGIAHPYPETIKFLNRNLPTLQRHGVKLVPLSALLPGQLIKLAKADSNNNEVETSSTTGQSK